MPLLENGYWSRGRYLPLRITTRHPHLSSGTLDSFGTLSFKFLDYTAFQNTTQDNPLKGLGISNYILIRQKKPFARNLNATLSYRFYTSNRKINNKILKWIQDFYVGISCVNIILIILRGLNEIFIIFIFS